MWLPQKPLPLHFPSLPAALKYTGNPQLIFLYFPAIVVQQRF